MLQCGFQSLGLLEQHWVQHTWAAQAWGQQQQASSSSTKIFYLVCFLKPWFLTNITTTKNILFGLFFETLVFDEHHRNKELKNIFYLVWFFDTLVFDKHHCNEEFQNIFYVSGLGRYLQPRQNGKCQFQGYLVSAAAAAAAAAAG